MAPPPRQQARRPPLLGTALLLLLLGISIQAARGFLLPSRPPALDRSTLLVRRQGSPFNLGGEEPWFSTVHVAEGEDNIVLETRVLQPTPREQREEAGIGQEHEVEDEEAEEQAAAEGSARKPRAPREYKVGVIVVDHGSRRREANDALEQVVADFRRVSGHALVEPAHMELAEPSIATAFGRCVEQGATFIVCHPFFLSRGRHVVEDIPTLMEEAASIFPGVGWALSQPLGLQADIPRLMQLAVAECMAEQNVRSEEHAAAAAEEEAQAVELGRDGMGL